MPQDRELVVAEEGRMTQIPPPGAQDRGGSSPMLTCLGFAFLTFNSAMAIYRSKGDPWAISFVTCSYVNLVLLFRVLGTCERAGDGHTNSRQRLRQVVWMLTTLLTVMFSYKVAMVMPPLMAVIVWMMAFAVVCGGFYGFFSSSRE